jgi:hypothetical protein
MQSGRPQVAGSLLLKIHQTDITARYRGLTIERIRPVKTVFMNIFALIAICGLSLVGAAASADVVTRA